MTQDEIIEMARQAGVIDDEHNFEFSLYKYLERFAKLVAAKEREACAELIEKETGMNPNWQKYLSAAISTRGQA
jgi:hypothetical protein